MTTCDPRDVDTTSAQYYALCANTTAVSGFEDIPPQQTYQPVGCGNVWHHPPMHLYVPVNKRYRHVCPGCGVITYVNSMEVYC